MLCSNQWKNIINLIMNVNSLKLYDISRKTLFLFPMTSYCMKITMKTGSILSDAGMMNIL